MRKLFKDRTTAAWRGFCLALVLATVAGCQSINHLRDAQSAFNQAAAEDLRSSFNSGATVGESTGANLFTNWVNTRALYGSALISLNKIGGEDEKILREEKLWGTKLALEALCLWKIGNYDKAVAIAKSARDSDQIYPRDRALMTALPGFIMIDYAFDLRAAPALPPSGSVARTNLVVKVADLTIGRDGAVDVIQIARSPDVIEPEHPVQVFLIQAQLAAYRNYRKTYELLDQRGVPTNAPAHTRAQSQLDDLAKRVSGPSGQALVAKWAALNILTTPAVP
jgi:hypothetical protein